MSSRSIGSWAILPSVSMFSSQNVDVRGIFASGCFCAMSNAAIIEPVMRAISFCFDVKSSRASASVVSVVRSLRITPIA